MREIKFRAWDKVEKRFVYNWQDSIFIEWYCFDGGDRYEVEQFTGLTDKNDVDIYEGDNAKKLGGRFCSTGTVKFIHGCWMVAEDDDHYFNLYHYHKELEITGNIHQNPELIKEQK